VCVLKIRSSIHEVVSRLLTCLKINNLMCSLYLYLFMFFLAVFLHYFWFILDYFLYFDAKSFFYCCSCFLMALNKMSFILKINNFSIFMLNSPKNGPMLFSQVFLCSNSIRQRAKPAQNKKKVVLDLMCP
jgi:hypothetical protein